MTTKGSPRRTPISKPGQRRVSAKISHLAKTEPSMPPKQRVAVSLNMEREKRLTAKGEYKPVKKRGKKK